MFCKKCGKTLNDSAEFCPFCGEKVAASSVSSMPPSSNSYSAIPNGAPQTSTIDKKQSFWKFIWCDYLYILLYLSICVSVLVFSVSKNMGGILLTSALSVLSIIGTIITWKTNQAKRALVMLLASLILFIIQGISVFF